MKRICGDEDSEFRLVLKFCNHIHMAVMRRVSDKSEAESGEERSAHKVEASAFLEL